jgi:hypothetical protein
MSIFQSASLESRSRNDGEVRPPTQRRALTTQEPCASLMRTGDLPHRSAPMSDLGLRSGTPQAVNAQRGTRGLHDRRAGARRSSSTTGVLDESTQRVDCRRAALSSPEEFVRQGNRSNGSTWQITCTARSPGSSRRLRFQRTPKGKLRL